MTPEDFPLLAGFKNDVEFELIGGGRPPKPTSLEDYKDFHERFIVKGDAINFVMVADGRVIGDCGLFNRDLVAGTAELGIGIGVHDYWSRGFGREAIGLLTDYGFRMLNLRRIWLEVKAPNERGIRCYRACGFVEEGRLRQHIWSDGRYVDLVHMGLLRDEWTGPAR
jgi:RimJ/RimL family protein N-acetyltransferase